MTQTISMRRKLSRINRKVARELESHQTTSLHRKHLKKNRKHASAATHSSLLETPLKPMSKKKALVLRETLLRWTRDVKKTTWSLGSSLTQKVAGQL